MSDIEIPESHPRYQSLLTRYRIEEDVEKSVTSQQGLTAQGRSGAFDCPLDERTPPSSDEATRAATTHLPLTDQPVISVNGSATTFRPGEVVDLATVVDADIEVNPFNHTDKRTRAIAAHLYDYGVGEVGGLTGDGRIPDIDHERTKADADGIGGADVAIVPLEDDGRAEALGAMDRVEIVIGLDPMSRPARVATAPTVDDIMRTVPNIATYACDLWGSDMTREELETTIADFDADAAFDAAEWAIRTGDE